MKALKSRQRGQFTPKVEVLEDRSLLNASITGVGHVVTTGAVNDVAITDDGRVVEVFSDKGFVGSRAEGTPLTVIAGVKGSTNDVEYALLGSTDPNDNFTTLNSTLTVNFGTGKGELFTEVLSSLPTVFSVPPTVGPQFSNLGASSKVNVTATSSSGNTVDDLQCRSVGANASLPDVDHGGKGNDSFNPTFFGGSGEFFGASVNLAFVGGTGNNTVSIDDFQDIHSGASTTINVSSNGSITNRENLDVDYAGQLQGSLTVNVAAGAGTNNNADLIFTLNPDSSGTLSSTVTDGPGTATVSDGGHKQAADTPSVTATAQGLGSGAKSLTRTIASSISDLVTDLGGFSTVVNIT